MVKMFKSVLVSGVLTTRNKEKYWLLEPSPVLKDWEQDRQQRFLVVPYEEIDRRDQNLLYSYPTHLVTTDPDILYIIPEKHIQVWDLQLGYEITEETVISDEPMPDDVRELLNLKEVNCGK